MKGGNAESLQFEFLIGDWDVKGMRYKPDGSVLLEYKARWSAHYLNGKRMIIDDFKTYSPSGQEVSSYVTLRTYSEVTGRWEMAGLSALQPAMNGEWFGLWKDGEMRLEAGRVDRIESFVSRTRTSAEEFLEAVAGDSGDGDSPLWLTLLHKLTVVANGDSPQRSSS